MISEILFYYFVLFLFYIFVFNIMTCIFWLQQLQLALHHHLNYTSKNLYLSLVLPMPQHNFVSLNK